MDVEEPVIPADEPITSVVGTPDLDETNVPSTPSMDMDEEGRAREEMNEEAPRRG